MSAPLPIIPKSSDESFSGLLNDLLFDQSNFSAVESFARWHESKGDTAHVPTSAEHYTALMPASAPKPGEQYAFEVDLDACSGCKACVVACHNLNNLEEDETWRKVGWLTSHQMQLPVVQHVTTACHHCVDPGCLSGCPVKAYEKDPLTGIVKHLDDQCFGCKYCTMMCPYEVPQYSATLGIVRKCDMCHQRLANHEAPACVQACPNAAIRIRIVNSADCRESFALTEAALLPTAPPSSITIPTTVYRSERIALSPSPTSSRAAQAAGSPVEVSRPDKPGRLRGSASSGMGSDSNELGLSSRMAFVSSESVNDEPHEGHFPLVGMLVLTQASVGLWMMIALSFTLSLSSAVELKLASIVATSLGVVGVHLALLHLGRPQLAYRAFLGWRTSWLSREAIAFGVYMAAAGLATTAILFSDVAGDWLGAFGIAMIVTTVAVIGIAAVVCSAMIYVATRRELWNMRRSFCGFIGTSVALGLALTPLTISSGITGVLALPACVITAAVFAPQLIDVTRPLFSSSPRSAEPEALADSRENVFAVQGRNRLASQAQVNACFSSRSGRLIVKRLALPWYAMWSCLLAALVSSGWMIASPTNATFFGVVAATALFASHLIHRWIYFSAVVTHRMPGAST